MTTGALTIDNGTEDVASPLTAGRAYGRNAGVEHDVINDNDFEFVFIEIEVK